MRFEFTSQSSQPVDDPGITSERLVNCYIEPAAAGSFGGATVRAVLGMEDFAVSPAPLARAILELNGTIYVCASARLYSVSSAGVSTELGTINDDVNTTMSSNGGNVTIAAGGTYYVWDGAALTTPGSGRITNVGSVSFLDGYTILTDADSGEFEWTALGDPKTRNALYFAEAESNNDKLRRATANGNELWLFGERSSEVWQNTGLSGANAFRNAAAIDRGIIGPLTVASIAEVQVMVGDDGVVYQVAGFRLQPISTPAVQADVAQSTPTQCFSYEDRGRKMAVVRFADRPAWVVDLTTGLWHERASTVYLGAWAAVGTARLDNVWYALASDGAVKKLARTAKDGSTPLVRVMQSKPITVDDNTFSVSELSLFTEYAPAGATVSMQVSRSGGVTWEPEMRRTVGRLSEARQGAQWHSLGAADLMAFRFMISDPLDVNLYSIGNVRFAGGFASR